MFFFSAFDESRIYLATMVAGFLRARGFRTAAFVVRWTHLLISIIRTSMAGVAYLLRTMRESKSYSV